jgi:hypothetical protein
VLTTKMSSWYGGVSTDARTAARRSGRRSARCAARVRRGGVATHTGLTTRHVRVRVPRDAVASIVGVSGCAWRGHRGAGARVRHHVHDAVGRGRSGTTRVAELRFENEMLHFFEYKYTQL